MKGPVIFDTNILIDFSHGDANAQDIIRQTRSRMISIVTWAEFLAGLPEPHLEKGRAFLETTFEIVTPDQDVWMRAVEIRRIKRMKLPDALIYATAKSLGAIVVTRNTKDFDADAADVYVPYG